MPNLESVVKKEHSEYLKHQAHYFNNKLLLFLDTILMCMTKTTKLINNYKICISFTKDGRKFQAQLNNAIYYENFDQNKELTK